MYTYGLTLEDLVQIPGIDPSTITHDRSTSRLTLGDLSAFLAEGCGQINGALETSGVTPDAALPPDSHARLRALARVYVQMRSMQILSVTGVQYDQILSAWETGYSEIARRPDRLGHGYTPPVRSKLDGRQPPVAWDYFGGGRGFTKNNF